MWPFNRHKHEWGKWGEVIQEAWRRYPLESHETSHRFIRLAQMRTCTTCGRTEQRYIV